MDYQLWTPEKQPDILGQQGSFANIEWGYNEIIGNLWEKLRLKYPDYIKRQPIGKDSTGTYEMYLYEFCPERPKKTFWIQSGVHVIETDAYFSFARLMSLIADGTDERLLFVRENVRFLIVPCVSPWGISNKGSYAHIMSGERYTIKHNSVGVNPNRDYFDEAAAETTAAKRCFARYAKEISIAFDFHTTTETGWGAYLLPHSDGMKKEIYEPHEEINRALYEKHPSKYVQAFMGEESKYCRPDGRLKPIYSSFIAGYSKDFGVPGFVVEQNDYVFDNHLGTSKAMTLAVELFGNHIICEAERE